ncbi:hypothetical protein F5887DRAFT_924858 [Amanita rubescens]|nr:hypothetical protein F5887DRAFT_924858 [Amanita rubescens]
MHSLPMLQKPYALAEILEDYAKNYEKASPKDKKAIQLWSNYWRPQDHPQSVSDTAFAFAAILAVSSAGQTKALPRWQEWAREWKIQKIKEANVTSSVDTLASSGRPRRRPLLHFLIVLFTGFESFQEWNPEKGLIADIVTRTRSDPMFTSNFNVLQRTLPHNYGYDSLFSFPEKSEAYVNRLDKTRSISGQRKQIKIVRTLKAISEVLNDPDTFSSLSRHDCDGDGAHLVVMKRADIILKGAVRRRYMQQVSVLNGGLRRGTENRNIDVIRDVIDATCIRRVCEMIFTFDFLDNSSWGMSEEKIKEARENCGKWS